jgi:methyl-accepting chemotaxis protein WspA
MISKLTIRGKILLLLFFFSLPIGFLGFTTLRLYHQDLSVTTSMLQGVRDIKKVFHEGLTHLDKVSFVTTQEKIDEISKKSLLVLDPSPDSYFLQSLLSNDLIQVIEHVVKGAAIDATEQERRDNEATLRIHVMDSFFNNVRNARLTEDSIYSKRKEVNDYLASLLDDQTSLKALIQKALTGDQKELTQTLQTLSNLEDRIAASLEDIFSERVARLQSEVIFAWTITLGTFFFLIVLSWKIVKNITSRIDKLILATNKAAEHGDLSQTVEDNGNDEIFELSQSFNSMASSLRTMVSKIVHSGSLINTSTCEIAAVSKQQQATSSEIAATTTQIEATSKQIALTSEHLAKSMQEVQVISGETASLAADGQTNLDKMRNTMQGITDASQGISQKLEILNQRASKIGDVVTTIAKVADQTNLLSLNAAIEAERAGEYGLGFAVVAREIRRLADQTAVSTLDIEQMVKEIQSSVAAGVMGMEKFSSEVKKGASEVEGTSAQFSTIISQIQTLTPTFQTVAEGMQSQVLGARQITESLSQLSTAARQTADSLSQSNVSIEQLHQATVLLDKEVERFELGEKA